jgi:hypothetical protein
MHGQQNIQFCKLVCATYYDKPLFTVLMKKKPKLYLRDFFRRNVSLLSNGVDIYGSPSFLDRNLDINNA